MPLVIFYLLKFSISLAAVYLFYHLLLRRLTFYNWNRWYFLGYSLLSFFIAAVNITPLLQENRLDTNDTIRLIPTIYSTTAQKINTSNQIVSTGFGVWDIMFFILGTGILLLMVQFLIRYFSYTQLRKEAELLHRS